MAIERERKFLVNEMHFPPTVYDMIADGHCMRIKTGYFTKDGIAIRVSLRDLGKPTQKCKICFKTEGGQMEREEFEYTIPEPDARRLLELSPTILRKERFEFEGWEIDYITINASTTEGAPILTNLWMAEWEEAPEKMFPATLPPWISTEVTEDPTYSNQALAWKYGRKEFYKKVNR